MMAVKNNYNIFILSLFFFAGHIQTFSQVTIFNETFPNADNPWNGTNDVAQDESTWSVIQGVSDNNDIRVGSVGGQTALRFHDCDDGFAGSSELAYIPINLDGYIGCTLNYDWYSDDVDAGEGMRVEYSTTSTNGINGTWTIIGSHINPVDDIWTASGALSIPDASALSTFMLRITSSSNATTENMYIDNIVITGTLINGTFGSTSISLTDSSESAVSNYTFTQTVPSDATNDFGITSGTTISITVPNGDLSTVSSATIDGLAATITSQTSTTIQLTMPAGQAEGSVFDIVLTGVTNFNTFGTYATNTVSVANNAGGTNLYTSYSYTIKTIIGPGGITAPDLKIWLKADQGTNTTTDGAAITSWSDQSGSLNHSTQGTATNQPTFENATNDLVNFNPLIQFDGVDDFLTITDNFQNDGEISFFCVLNQSTALPDFSTVYTSDNLVLDIEDNSSDDWGYWGTFQNSSGNSIIGEGMVILTLTGSDALPGTGYRDGRSIFTGTENLDVGGGFATTTSIGAYADGSADFYPGTLTEIIYSNDIVTSSQQNKIESYLAIKYGITLDNTTGGTAGDYTSTNGTIVWDASLNSAYHNDVIGISRDSIEELLQKQSHTIDDTTRLFVSTLATDNISNVGTITNNESYIMIGHNGGRMIATAIPSPEQPVGIYSRIEREWKVTNTGFADDYSIELKLETPNGSINLADLRLLVDTDGDFSDATIVASPNVTFSLGSVIISGIGTAEIPLNSTRYITLASASVGTPLPIELVEFSAIAINNTQVELNWKTASEVNNDYFTIEKSKDGFSWEEVTTVDGAGNSSTIIRYTEYDNIPYLGISYYRLKQTDFDGHFSYSNVESVDIKDFRNQVVRIYPNPFTNQITLVGDKTELSEITIYNALGQNITDLVKPVMNTEAKLIFDFNNLSSGIYYIKTKSTVNKIHKQ